MLGYAQQKTNCKADRTAKKGNKIITLLSCPISLTIGFLFYSTLLILIYTKIQLRLATVCPSGPCTELPDLCSAACLSSPYCSPDISYGTSKENLSKNHDISSLVITLFSSLECLYYLKYYKEKFHFRHCQGLKD